jgi:hypothetical protein
MRRHGLHVSLSTVQRVARSGHNPLRWLPIKSRKQLNAKNIPLRLAFCERHLDDDFSSSVFLDAKDLYLYYEADGRAKFCWQTINGSAPAPALSNPWVFRFYAVVGLDFKSQLIFVAPTPPEGSKSHKSRERYTHKQYIVMMEQLKVSLDLRYPQGGYRIIQDHARQHTAKAAKAAIASMGMAIVDDFPAQLWDINVIENVWGVLDDYLIGSRARTTKDWYVAIRKAWKAISQETINSLVAGVPFRLQKIIEAKGAWVKHH